MKIPIAVAAALLGTLTAHAQVACSPKVESSTCRAVADRWNAALDHMILRGAAISVELLAPSEYDQRAALVHKEDAAAGPKYQAFDNMWTGNILFFREPGSRHPFPEKVLVSVEAFADIATDKSGQPILEDFENDQGRGKRPVMDHKFHLEKTHEIINFIAGYFQGMSAAYSDELRGRAE